MILYLNILVELVEKQINLNFIKHMFTYVVNVEMNKLKKGTSNRFNENRALYKSFV